MTGKQLVDLIQANVRRWTRDMDTIRNIQIVHRVDLIGGNKK